MIVRGFFKNRPSVSYQDTVGVSETIPDQSLSVRDILNRFTRGQMTLPPVDYDHHDDFDTPDDFDPMLDDPFDLVQNGNMIYDDVTNLNVTNSDVTKTDENVTES